MIRNAHSKEKRGSSRLSLEKPLLDKTKTAIKVTMKPTMARRV